MKASGPVLPALLLALGALCAGPGSALAEPGSAPGTRASPAAPAAQSVPPPVRLEVGPDRIACGVTAPVPPSSRPTGRRTLGLILWFHGGMRSPNREKGLEAHRPLINFADPKAHVFASPSAFAGRDWLAPEALATIESLIDTLVATYPIDPADLRLVGVSDGTLAVIRYGLEGRRTARAKLLVSSLPQLALPQERLAASPRLDEGRWDMLQGARDRLFPAQAVFPYLEDWQRLHPNAHAHLYPEGEHDFGWYAVQAAPLLRELLATQKTQKVKALQKGPKKT